VQNCAIRSIFIATNLLLASCADNQLQQAPVEMTARERAASEVRVDPADAAIMISEYRREHALSGVQPDLALQKFAQAQADVMAARDLLSHEVDGNLIRRLEAANLREKLPSKMSRLAIFHSRTLWVAGAAHPVTMPICSMRRCTTWVSQQPMHQEHAIKSIGRWS